MNYFRTVVIVEPGTYQEVSDTVDRSLVRYWRYQDKDMYHQYHIIGQQGLNLDPGLPVTDAMSLDERLTVLKATRPAWEQFFPCVRSASGQEPPYYPIINPPDGRFVLYRFNFHSFRLRRDITPRTPLNTDPWEQLIAHFIINVSDIDSELIPGVIVTPEGQWFEGRVQVFHNREKDFWTRRAQALLSPYKGYWAVFLDMYGHNPNSSLNHATENFKRERCL